MTALRHVLVVGLWALFGSRSAGICLPEGIAATSRKYIETEDGPSPIKLLVYDWASAELGSTLAAMLIEEVLGYHAAVDLTRTVTVFEGLLALAGCADFDCTQSVERKHVAVESWLSEVITLYPAFREAHPTICPEDMGTMGYFGNHNLFVKASVRDDAYHDVGLALEFYRSYNTSHHNPKKYFDSIHDIPQSQFYPCNTSGNEFVNTVRMELYLQYTGDADGVMQTPEGYVAYCPDSYHWLSPACRHNASTCIPVIAAGNGWIIDAQMQWATAYGFPVAIGIAASWDLYVEQVATYRTLFYWWEPDATHMQLNPTGMVFPRHIASEWEAGNLRTAGEDSYIGKLASLQLRTAAPQVREFLSKMELELAQVSALLLDVANGASFQNASCQWLLANRRQWEKWIPVNTNCLPGFGIVDAAGAAVDNRDAATGCALCPAGTFSAPLADSFGQTYRCESCQPGSAQSLQGEVSCSACDPGTVAPATGQKECDLCGLGSYANQSGMTACVVCADGSDVWTTSRNISDRGQEKWIQIAGASSESFCVCVEGFFLYEGQCQPCMEGSSCPGSGQLSVLPGYFSWADTPGEIYQCFGSELRCPGGQPGTCADGRDTTSVTCFECLPGLRADDTGACGLCASGDYAMLTLVLITAVAAIVLLYYFLMREGERNTQPGHLLVIALGLSQLVTVIQKLTVIQKFRISWREPILSILNFFELMGLNLDMLSVSCVASMGPVAKYALRSLIAPIFVCVVMVVHTINLLCKRKLTSDPEISQLLRTIGSLFLIFFISVFTAILAPFQCNFHPNGRSTVQEYHSVFCDGQAEHMQMSLIGGFASLMPVAFLAVCTWVTLVELPRRLLQADVRFVRACSFLYVRFRPGAEIFSVLYLLRNALIVLCPLIPSVSTKLVCMNLLLYASLTMTSFFKPWRVMAGNLLDTLLQICLIVVLDMASVFVDGEVDADTSIAICVFFLVLMLFAILAAVAYGGVMHVKLKRQKPFRFFLCHQKLAAGGVARLLKMRLQKRSTRNTTFVDSDDLNDLTRLFSYVGQDTQTFVVLASPDVLLRKWCIGEMCTARVHKVHTVLVKWPEYQDPDGFFIDSMEDIIPGVTDLANYNISMDDVRETLKFLTTVESFVIPTSLSQESISLVCEMLMRSSTTPSTSSMAKGAAMMASAHSGKFSSEIEREPISPDCPILVQHGNIEAEAAAYVLMDLLIPRVNKATRCSLPTVLKEGAEIPHTTVTALLICSEGCFKCPQIARWLFQLCKSTAWSLVPIIAEDRFVVPAASFFEDLRSPASAMQLKVDVDRYALLIKAVFQEISTVFVPQMYSSTQEDLELRAKQVAWRLQSEKLTPLSVKLQACEERQGTEKHSNAKPDADAASDSQLRDGSTDARMETPETGLQLDLPSEEAYVQVSY